MLSWGGDVHLLSPNWVESVLLCEFFQIFPEKLQGSLMDVLQKYSISCFQPEGKGVGISVTTK